MGMTRVWLVSANEGEPAAGAVVGGGDGRMSGEQRHEKAEN